jgi:hypothetical protein
MDLGGERSPWKERASVAGNGGQTTTDSVDGARPRSRSAPRWFDGPASRPLRRMRCCLSARTRPRSRAPDGVSGRCWRSSGSSGVDPPRPWSDLPAHVGSACVRAGGNGAGRGGPAQLSRVASAACRHLALGDVGVRFGGSEHHRVGSSTRSGGTVTAWRQRPQRCGAAVDRGKTSKGVNRVAGSAAGSVPARTVFGRPWFGRR